MVCLKMAKKFYDDEWGDEPEEYEDRKRNKYSAKEQRRMTRKEKSEKNWEMMNDEE